MKSVRDQIVDLQNAFERERQKMQACESEGRRIKNVIASLRASCPHTTTHGETILDCAEFKERQCCDECGVEL